MWLTNAKWCSSRSNNKCWRSETTWGNVAVVPCNFRSVSHRSDMLLQLRSWKKFETNRLYKRFHIRLYHLVIGWHDPWRFHHTTKHPGFVNAEDPACNKSRHRQIRFHERKVIFQFDEWWDGLNWDISFHLPNLMLNQSKVSFNDYIGWIKRDSRISWNHRISRHSKGSIYICQ